jgi:hypothetical protein
MLSSWLRSDDEYTYEILLGLDGEAILPETLLSDIVPLLASPFELYRFAANQVLQHKSTLSDEILGQIVESFASSKACESASGILSRQATLSDPILCRILAQFDNDKLFVRISALRALSNQKALTDEVLDKIIALLDDDERELRAPAAEVLCNQTELTKHLIDRVVALLDDDQHHVQVFAVQALGRHKALTADRLNCVITLLGHDERDIQIPVLEVLGKNTRLPDNIVGKILLLLDNRNYYVRYAAIGALAVQTVLANEVLCRMRALLDADDELLVRCAAQQTLCTHAASSDMVSSLLEERNFRRSNEYTIEAMMKQVEQGTFDEQREALRALSYEPTLAEALPAMLFERILDLQNPFLMDAIKAFVRPGLSPTIVSRIAEHLNNHDVSATACRVLLAQSELSAATMVPHLKPFYIALLEASWERDICWVSTSSGSHLRVGDRSIPLLGWNSRMTAKIRGIATTLGVPQPDRRNVIAKHWAKIVSTMTTVQRNEVQRW